MSETSIEWTDATWNPVAGCTIVTAGCTNCYAMKMAARLEAMGVEKYKGLTRRSGDRHVWSGKLRLDEEALEIPARWKKAKRVFVNSMSDLFHEDVPTAFIARVWQAMAAAPQHTFQILTKRPERMALVLSDDALFKSLGNVWLGTSVEDSRTLGRLDELRRTPAAVRFVSFEPLIGSVCAADLKGIDWAIVGVRTTCAPDESRVAKRNTHDVRARRHGILFQAMGRSQQEGERPVLSWSNLGRFARV
jgi:protein gp37